MTAFRHLSLSRQFLIASFPILLLGMVAIGVWVAREIEHGVVNRLGAVTSLYVESMVAPHLTELVEAETLAAPDRAALDAILSATPLGQKIVAFNLWGADGRLLYSTDAAVIGRTFPIGHGLAAALRGDVFSRIADRSELEHGTPDPRWPQRLIETYTPVHTQTMGPIIGAAEFYQTTDELARETRAAQLRSWAIVAATMSVMYLLLFGLVRRGSRTIAQQRRELRQQVAEQAQLLERNAELHARVRGAAARTTALNERFLRRISADLHDGPGQDLGFALMRLETMTDHHASGAPTTLPPAMLEDLRAVRSSLESALVDLRSISAGLQLPEIDGLGTAEIAARAVRDYERKTGVTVKVDISGDAADVSLPVRLTLYRFLQEALANGFRHAGGADQRVSVTHPDHHLVVEVKDAGPGFDASTDPAGERLGMAGMRERVQALAGTFELHGTPGHGTVVRATLPTRVPGIEDE